MMNYILVTFTLLSALINGAAHADNQQALWQQIKNGGHVVLMRHALAPGFGDPDNFRVDDCSTQRNLSEEGRQQAKAIGGRFRTNGITEAEVYSSQWCRCLETAELLGLGEASELPIINSFFQRFERREQQTQSLRQWLQQQDLSSPVVLVTHQVNITALTGVTPASGEIVVITIDSNDNIELTGRLQTPH